MLNEYINLLLLFLVALGLGLILPTITQILGPSRKKPLKDMAYESGMDPIGNAHERFSIKFYLIAMVFIIFDVEVIFMYPWAAQFKELGAFAFMEMLVFMIILFVGYIYLYKKGGFDWE